MIWTRDRKHFARLMAVAYGCVAFGLSVSTYKAMSLGGLPLLFHAMLWIAYALTVVVLVHVVVRWEEFR